MYGWRYITGFEGLGRYFMSQITSWHPPSQQTQTQTDIGFIIAERLVDLRTQESHITPAGCGTMLFCLPTHRTKKWKKKKNLDLFLSNSISNNLYNTVNINGVPRRLWDLSSTDNSSRASSHTTFYMQNPQNNLSHFFHFGKGYEKSI